MWWWFHSLATWASCLFRYPTLKPIQPFAPQPPPPAACSLRIRIKTFSAIVCSRLPPQCLSPYTQESGLKVLPWGYWLWQSPFKTCWPTLVAGHFSCRIYVAPPPIFSTFKLPTLIPSTLPIAGTLSLSLLHIFDHPLSWNGTPAETALYPERPRASPGSHPLTGESPQPPSIWTMTNPILIKYNPSFS